MAIVGYPAIIFNIPWIIHKNPLFMKYFTKFHEILGKYFTKCLTFMNEIEWKWMKIHFSDSFDGAPNYGAYSNQALALHVATDWKKEVNISPMLPYGLSNNQYKEP